MIAKAHHGSVSKEQRALIEDDLKRGRLPAVVATSSLELGIDMGAVDLVVQIESPPSVASALQRVGRAGHQVGEVSRGRAVPQAPRRPRPDRGRGAADAQRRHRVAARARPTRSTCSPSRSSPPPPLDGWHGRRPLRPGPPQRAVRPAPAVAPTTPTLDLLSGRYPSDEFAELRPRIVWDRVTGTLTGRPGAQRLAVTSGGTIPDRGLFGVFLVGARARAAGSASSTRRWSTSPGSATSSRSAPPAGGSRTSPTTGCWSPPRPASRAGCRSGRATPSAAPPSSARRSAPSPASSPRCRRAEAEQRAQDDGLDAYAAGNLVAYLHEQLEATQRAAQRPAPSLVERFRDELGDWRLVVHSPYGTPVHAPWALAINARLRERYGIDGQAVASDDGIVIRIPDTDAEPPGGEVVVFEPDEIDELVTQEVGGSRAVRRPGSASAPPARCCSPAATRAAAARCGSSGSARAALLEVAASYPSFPIVLEAVRECLQDVYDLPAPGRADARGRAARGRRSSTSSTTQPVAVRPEPAVRLRRPVRLRGRLPHRRAPGRRALASTRACSPSCSAAPSCASCSTPRCSPRSRPSCSGSRPTGAPATPRASPTCCGCSARSTTAEVARAVRRRRRRRRVAGRPGRHPPGGRGPDGRRGALGRDRGRRPAPRRRSASPVPPGTPDAFTDPVDDPLADLVARYARTHGPFTTDDVAARLGLGARRRPAHPAAARRPRAGCSTASSGPAGSGTEWCDAEVLRSAAPPLPGPAAQGGRAGRAGGAGPVPRRLAARRAARLRGVDGVLTVIDQLAGCPVPASGLEPLVLAARVRDYEPSYLDELTAAGEVLWAGHGALPGTDGWVSPPPRRPGAAHAARARAASSTVRAAPGGARRARARRRLVLPPARPAGRRAPDDEALQRDAVGPGLGRPGQQRHPRPAARAHPLRHAEPPHQRPPARPRWPRPPAAAVPRCAPARPRPPAAGRCCPTLDTDPTRRAHAAAERLLDRHGVVTRGAVVSERVPGGFAAVYKVLSAFEDSGRCRRGYFVEGLGAAQFGTAGAIDRLRTFSEVDDPSATSRTPSPGRHRPGQPLRRRAPLARAAEARAGTARAARPAPWSSSSTAS